MAMVSKDGLKITDKLTIAITINSLSSAIRFLGYLYEMGMEARIDDSSDFNIQVLIKCYGAEVDNINFALYLTEKWVDDASV